MKFWCQGLYLLTDVRFRSMLFLETPVLFSNYTLLCQLVMQPYLNYWCVRHTAERFLSEYVPNGNRTLEVVLEETLRYCFCFRNELQNKSKYATANLSFLSKIHVHTIYSYLTTLNLVKFGLLFCKIYIITSF